jgi:hypothetical protein
VREYLATRRRPTPYRCIRRAVGVQSQANPYRPNWAGSLKAPRRGVHATWSETGVSQRLSIRIAAQRSSGICACATDVNFQGVTRGRSNSCCFIERNASFRRKCRRLWGYPPGTGFLPPETGAPNVPKRRDLMRSERAALTDREKPAENGPFRRQVFHGAGLEPGTH